MTYRQLTSEERYMLAALRRQGLHQSEIARALGRHRSTVWRELRRNSTRADCRYRAAPALERTYGRRSRSRRNQRFSAEDFVLIDELLRRQWSPEQVAGHLRREGRLSGSVSKIAFQVSSSLHVHPAPYFRSAKEKVLPPDCKLRRVKYLNKIIEQDHRAIRRRWWAMNVFARSTRRSGRWKGLRPRT